MLDCATLRDYEMKIHCIALLGWWDSNYLALEQNTGC